MANPRELAEKAISALQDALRDSENRVSELDSALKRKRMPRNRLEEQVEVLGHRLEVVEADSEHWRREAGHLEEVLENERAKIKQLKTKLELAESGPDRLTKKEINFWRQRAEMFDAEMREYKNRIASLREELKEGRPNETGDPWAAAAEAETLAETLRQAEAENERLQGRLTAQETQIGELLDELGSLREVRKQAELDTSSSSAEIESIRSQLSDVQNALSDAHEIKAALDDRVMALETELREAQQTATEAQTASQKFQDALNERDSRLVALSAELEKTRTELANRDAALEAVGAEVEQLREHGADASSSTVRELEQKVNALEQLVAHKEQALSTAQTSQGELERELKDARDRIADLEDELKEEKECTENLSEIANERRETMIQLEEKLEEAEERYEEVKWRLGKAQHFERLVRRRKGLIASLIETVRAKNKANVALKAGLDGLRRYKATAEASQHKLLARMDGLKTELAQARDELKTRQTDPAEGATIDQARAKIAELEERLNMQAELIQSLEGDLQTAKTVQLSVDDQSARIEELEQTLAAKDEAIGKLEADADEQQRKLAKLRGTESESTRLKGITEQDKSKIDALEREIAQLRETLMRKAGGTEDLDLLDKLKERDSSIVRLMGTVKEQETKLAELTNAVENWKRKYEFLSADSPTAYQSVAEK